MQSKIKIFFINNVFFILKIFFGLFALYLCIRFLKNKVFFEFLGRIFSEERGKKNIKKLEKAGKKVKKVRVRLQSLKDEINDFLNNSGQLYKLDSNGDPIK